MRFEKGIFLGWDCLIDLQNRKRKEKDMKISFHIECGVFFGMCNLYWNNKIVKLFSRWNTISNVRPFIVEVNTLINKRKSFNSFIWMNYYYSTIWMDSIFKTLWIFNEWHLGEEGLLFRIDRSFSVENISNWFTLNFPDIHILGHT